MAKKNANEYLISVITKISMVAVGLAYSVLLARYLGATTKGSISYVQSIVAIGSIILSFGMHQAYPYYRKTCTDVPAFISEYMSSMIALFSTYFIVAIIVALSISVNREIKCSIVLSPLWAYTRVSGYVLLVEKPNKRNITLLALSIVETIYVLILFLFTDSSFAFGISAITLVEVIKSILFTTWIPFKWDIRKIKLPLIKSLINYGFFPMIALLMTTLNYRIDVLMLKNSSAIVLAQVGVYSIGCSLAEKALLIPDAVKEILLSKLAKGKGADEVATVSRICFFIAVLVASVIVIIGKPFIGILYGAEYTGAYQVTAISVFGTVFMVFFKMIGQFNIVNRKQVINTVFLAISILINIILNRMLIPVYGINGAAYATVAGHLVCTIMFIVYFSKVTGIGLKNIILINRSDLRMIKLNLTRRR